MDFFTGLRNSITVKLFVIGFLTLLLLIPLKMVSSLIDERADYQDDVAHEIYSTWGLQQHIKGPILTLPYRVRLALENKNGKTEYINQTKYLHLLPDSLIVDGRVEPSILYRSIYEAVVYRTDLNISGEFSFPDFNTLGINPKTILWDKLTISLGIRDLRGVQERIRIHMVDKTYFFNPGIESAQVQEALNSGVSFPFSLSTHANLPFSFNLKLNGSQALFFSPYGKETRVTLASSWTNPSFIGGFLPDSREIGAKGFSAQWHVIDINRPYPQIFKGESITQLVEENIKRHPHSTPYGASSLGVDLKIPVDYYQKNERSTKYGFLVIFVSFIALFFVETFTKRKIHAFQYILVGFALVLFFSLLLAFSEYLGFDRAYLIASLATLILITLYAKSLFDSLRHVAILSGIIALFYAFIYLLIQLQDYSLLLGVIMLFSILGAVMYVSRNIDWYQVKKES